jgi:hypothetical protein
MDRDAIIGEIRRVAREQGLSRLSQRQFCSARGVAAHVVARHFDRWSQACTEAGIACETQDKLVPNRGASRQECLDDILRVATQLGTRVLTREGYKKYGQYPGLKPIYRHFGSWPSALDAAGLERPSSYREPTPFEALATEFIQVALTLGRLPTVREWKRRSERKVDHFIAKQGGYTSFKSSVADWYIGNAITKDIQLGGDALSALLASRSTLRDTPVDDPAPHRRGSILGFRQFAYAPTQEQDVVGIVNSVAQEVGFEIVANRVKFPDCLARERQPGARSHYLECRIEFEFRSSDYRAHGHPWSGCDLIVCWEHDWERCPIRVLELSTRIRQLTGWR